MSQFSARVLYWSPRMLGIAYALFLSIFALDVFQEVHGIRDLLVGLTVHLIPSFIIVGIVVIAWKWEWLGAVLFPLAVAGYTWWSLPAHLDWALMLGTPLLVIAGLFLANWIERAKVRRVLVHSQLV